ncbi:hypothetical protein [Marichromatium gracile]|uniref:Uncharacterized protein n=1 Tax=Marichromatium gracile TaxID=1048 RepID=A0A4R4A4S9_MARGR|nr:hypothetical protein [Marichromatium gracile]TCW32656.1 hypothetical protein EDC29_11722 [Marichromatium gracile]
MAIDDLRRMIAGHGFEDDAEACLDRAGCSEAGDEFARSSWPIPALRDEVVSALDIAIGLHRARQVAPAGALDEDCVYHCAAALQGVTELCARLLADIPDVTGREVRDAA